MRRLAPPRRLAGTVQRDIDERADANVLQRILPNPTTRVRDQMNVCGDEIGLPERRSVPFVRSPRPPASEQSMSIRADPLRSSLAGSSRTWTNRSTMRMFHMSTRTTRARTGCLLRCAGRTRLTGYRAQGGSRTHFPRTCARGPIWRVLIFLRLLCRTRGRGYREILKSLKRIRPFLLFQQGY